jgi:hypothetical protein
MPELSPEQKLNPEVATSGKSDFESAKESPALEPTRRLFDIIEGGPQVVTKRTKQTEFVKYIKGGPQDDTKEHDPLGKSRYFTKP